MFKTIQCPLISEVIGEYQSYKKIIKKTRFQPIAQTTVKKINWLVRHFRKPCDWRQRHKQLSVLKYLQLPLVKITGSMIWSVFPWHTHQGEALRGGSPAFDVGQVPLLYHLLCLLIHPHHTLLGDTQQTRHQFVFALHFLLQED